MVSFVAVLALITEHIKCGFLPFLNQKPALSDSETEGGNSSLYKCDKLL